MKTYEEIQERFGYMLDLRMGQLECGEGWHDLIWASLEKMEKHIPEEGWKIPIIKEKFGALNIQFHRGTMELRDISQDAEMLSQTICECCGVPAKTVKRDGWDYTLCNTCLKGDKND
jgi:hypothetical protein